MEEEVDVIKIVPADAIISVGLPSHDTTSNASAGATLKAILEKLPEASNFHVACHGKQDPNNALNSGFILENATLTVA